MIRIGAMVSGGGTNLQAVLDAIDAGKIDGQVVTVVSSKEGAYAMERAAKHNIPSVVISKRTTLTVALKRHLLTILSQ